MTDPEAPKTGTDEEALAGATPSTGGLECPTCGDRFPSRESLEEHVPSHTVSAGGPDLKAGEGGVGEPDIKG
jgi:hypothetical protein